MILEHLNTLLLGLATITITHGAVNMHVGMSFDYLLRQYSDRAANSSVFFMDGFYTKPADIAALHQNNKVVMCFFSAGTVESWRPDFFGYLNGNLTGDLVKDYGNGLNVSWVDLKQKDNLFKFLDKRISFAKIQGCDGIDWANLNSWMFPTGLNLTDQDALSVLRDVSVKTRAAGLLAGLNNNLRLAPQLISEFDFAVTTECPSRNDCDQYKGFINAGKPVFIVDYMDTNEQIPPPVKCSRVPANMTAIIIDRAFLSDVRIDCTTDAAIIKSFNVPKVSSNSSTSSESSTSTSSLSTAITSSTTATSTTTSTTTSEASPLPSPSPPPPPPPLPTQFWVPTRKSNFDFQLSGLSALGSDFVVADGFQYNGGANRKVVCYFNGGGVDKNAPDVKQVEEAVGGISGGLFTTSKNGFGREFAYIPITNFNKLRAIYENRLASARTRGCDAVVWDRVYQSFEAAPDMGVMVAFALNLRDITTKAGLSFGIVNSDELFAELDGPNTLHFAFTVNCMNADQCSMAGELSDTGVPVFGLHAMTEQPNQKKALELCKPYTDNNLEGIVRITWGTLPAIKKPTYERCTL